jgi:hypothetical protein
LNDQKYKITQQLSDFHQILRNKEHSYALEIWECVELERQKRKELNHITEEISSIKIDISSALKTILWQDHIQMRNNRRISLISWYRKVLLTLTGESLSVLSCNSDNYYGYLSSNIGEESTPSKAKFRDWLLNQTVSRTIPITAISRIDIDHDKSKSELKIKISFCIPSDISLIDNNNNNNNNNKFNKEKNDILYFKVPHHDTCGKNNTICCNPDGGILAVLQSLCGSGLVHETDINYDIFDEDNDNFLPDNRKELGDLMEESGLTSVESIITSSSMSSSSIFSSHSVNDFTDKVITNLKINNSDNNLNNFTDDEEEEDNNDDEFLSPSRRLTRRHTEGAASLNRPILDNNNVINDTNREDSPIHDVRYSESVLENPSSPSRSITTPSKSNYERSLSPIKECISHSPIKTISNNNNNNNNNVEPVDYIRFVSSNEHRPDILIDINSNLDFNSSPHHSDNAHVTPDYKSDKIRLSSSTKKSNKQINLDFRLQSYSSSRLDRSDNNLKFPIAIPTSSESFLRSLNNTLKDDIDIDTLLDLRHESSAVTMNIPGLNHLLDDLRNKRQYIEQILVDAISNREVLLERLHYLQSLRSLTNTPILFDLTHYNELDQIDIDIKISSDDQQEYKLNKSSISTKKIINKIILGVPPAEVLFYNTR